VLSGLQPQFNSPAVQFGLLELTQISFTQLSGVPASAGPQLLFTPQLQPNVPGVQLPESVQSKVPLASEHLSPLLQLPFA
jgi:hypothetical protein